MYTEFCVSQRADARDWGGGREGEWDDTKRKTWSEISGMYIIINV